LEGVEHQKLKNPNSDWTRFKTQKLKILALPGGFALRCGDSPANTARTASGLIYVSVEESLEPGPE